MNYQHFSDKLTGRNHDSRKIANNTYLIRDGEMIHVRLHHTNVVTYYPNGNISFNSGGYRTLTTKARMNQFSPASIAQKNGHWSIRMANKTDWVDFADGVIWEAQSNSWCGHGNAPNEKEQVTLSRRLKKFSVAYMKAFDAGKVPAPGAGDCWGCALKTKDGKTAMGNGHILSHLDESYFVPFLLANAIERFPVSMAAKAYVAEKWNGVQFPSWGLDFVKEQVQKSLYRYLKAEMGIAA